MGRKGYTGARLTAAALRTPRTGLNKTSLRVLKLPTLPAHSLGYILIRVATATLWLRTSMPGGTWTNTRLDVRIIRIDLLCVAKEPSRCRGLG